MLRRKLYIYFFAIYLRFLFVLFKFVDVHFEYIESYNISEMLLKLCIELNDKLLLLLLSLLLFDLFTDFYRVHLLCF